MRVVGSKTVLSMFAAKPSDWIMPSTRSRVDSRSVPRTKPKVVDVHDACVRPDLRTMSAAALKRQKVPAEALRPKGKTHKTYPPPPELEVRVLPVRRVDSDVVVGGGKVSGDETMPHAAGT